MKYPFGTLTEEQARNFYFVVPELPWLPKQLNTYILVLGEDGYRHFKESRKRLRALGGELLLIGWPDGTTITYSLDDSSEPIDLDTLVSTYRASAAMNRITRTGFSK